MHSCRRLLPRRSALALVTALFFFSVPIAATAQGTIAGTVTDGTLPLFNIYIAVYDNDGAAVGWQTTDSSGHYSIAVPDGTYRVQTRNGLGYFDEAWDDVRLVGRPDPALGTPITVAGDSHTANFVLERGGVISGRVTDSSSAGLANVSVTIYNDHKQWMAEGYTNATGEYTTTPGLETGDYFAVTSNTAGYIEKAYNDVQCAPCFPDTTTAIPVTAGVTTEHIDFTLAPGATVQGTVSAAGGPALEGVLVEIYNSAGLFVTFGFSGSAGSYVTGPGLPPGTYYALTRNQLGYLDQLYNGYSCAPTCAPTSGTPLTVIGTDPISGINFSLSLAGRIGGTVTAAIGSAPLPGISVGLYDGAGGSVTGTTTDALGQYLFDRLVPGTYYLKIEDSPGYVPELYDDNLCFISCTITDGDAVSVVSGVTTTANFALSTGATIRGRVTTGGGATPLAGIQVSAYQLSGWGPHPATTDSNGDYTISGLAPGSYRVRTLGPTTYINEYYDDAPLFPDGLPSARVFTFAGDEVETGIDFDLAQGGRIAGFVRRADTLAGIGGVNVIVAGTDSVALGYGYTQDTGEYLTDAVPPGQYYVWTANSAGFSDELFDNKPYTGSTAGGNLVTITAGAVSTVNFELGLGGSIAGRVTDASTSSGVPDFFVQVLDLYGDEAGFGYTDAAGNYTVSGLPTGSYRVRTQAAFTGYINQAYDGITCLGLCSSRIGTIINVTDGAVTPAIDFVLVRGGTISGTVIDGDGHPIDQLSLDVLTASGTRAGFGFTDAAGVYHTSGLPTGTYFVRTTNSAGYLEEIYDDVRCEPYCDPLSATPVSVTLGSNTPNVNFSLELGGRIAGRVAGPDGSGLWSVRVNVYDALGRNWSYGWTDESGNYVTSAGLPPGDYFLSTYNDAGLIDEMWQDIPCQSYSCVPSGTTPVTVTGTGIVAGIDFQLAAGGRIAGRITDAVTGELVPGAVIIYNADGAYVSESVWQEGIGYVSARGLADGLYFVRAGVTIGPQAGRYFGAVWHTPDNLPCIGFNCAITTGTPVSVTAGITTGGIDFPLQRGARISGNVTDTAGNPIPGVTVNVYDAAGTHVVTGRSNTIGEFWTYEGLPSGSYFLKTSNSLGWMNELYNDHKPCFGCDVTLGDPVSATAGSETTGIAIALERGGQIAGTVTDGDGLPLPRVTVSILDAAGTRLTRVATDAFGRYTTGEGLPTGQYYARTENSVGLVNEVYNNVSCATGCPLASGTLIDVTLGSVTGGIDFSLVPDTDADGDGIPASIDKDKVTGVDESGVASDDFTDVPIGGTTAGTLNRPAIDDVRVADVPGGVNATLQRSTAASVLACDTGGAEEVLLDVLGEKAYLACIATGSIYVRAELAAPLVQVRKPDGGGGYTVVDLNTRQGVTMGSPITADGANTLPIVVTYVHGGNVVGSFQLEAGESVDSTLTAGGELVLTVLSGNIVLTVGGDTYPLNEGESFSSDDESPAVGSVVATPNDLWPPNHRMVGVALAVAATDNSGVAPSCTIANVTSNEPANGLGDGDTAPDWIVNGPLALDLRAERSGKGNGRIYTIEVTCTDAAGNTSAPAITTVTVAKSQKTK